MAAKYLPFAFVLLLFAFACGETQPVSSAQTVEVTPTFQDKGHELVYQMTQKTGDYADLRKLKDVVYTYTYKTPDGKADVSTEKYRFDGELSLGTYVKHERTLPQLEGAFTQGYDGQEFWLEHKGEYTEEEELLQRARFNRKTNFYWFAMFQKMLDPGLKYEYLGEKEVEGQAYEVVNVSFSPADSTPTDIYQLFLNKETHLVDQFLFTVADFGVMETPLLMRVEYEEVKGILIPSKRKYKRSSWDATVSDAPWVEVHWTDIRFNNGLKRSDFSANP